MTMTNGERWRKSTYSGGENNDCVELAHTLDTLRDSKNPTGPVLKVGNLTAFMQDIKHSRFDL
jgi:hypothetical protein